MKDGSRMNINKSSTEQKAKPVYKPLQMPTNKIPAKPLPKNKEVIRVDKKASESKLRVQKRASRLSPNVP